MSGEAPGWHAAAMARHLICILALMWTALVNGQPFFFDDTTNYIRAADSAVFVASGHRISTAWTERYRDAVVPSPAAASEQAGSTTPNDVSSGTIMAGRSPYFGAVLWLGYVIGDFWPFVVMQAVFCYLLMLLALRRFGIERPRTILLTVVGIAATTALPTYNGLLLADAFAGFGVIAFLLLATPGRLTQVETAFLVGVVLLSTMFHLTHIAMLAGMVGAMILLVVFRVGPPPPRRAWLTGVAGIVIGLLSVQATALVAQAAFGKAPQLLPLLTARFYMDGPGRRFIESGCDGRRFTVCRIAIGAVPTNPAFLFSTDPREGAFMIATPADRERMGAEDTAFALAVLRHDPLGQTAKIGENMLRQLAWIDYDGLNTGCFAQTDCWSSLPPKVRATLRASPSGRNAWPVGMMNALLYVVVIASLAVIAWVARRSWRSEAVVAKMLRTWVLLGGAALLTNAFFGGAVADPQYRYQGRMIWLVVLLAAMLLPHMRGVRKTPDGIVPG
ncbi:hypothetical protein [Sphingomonas prati]|uniref:Glycosyltransferase RgtA/B/C/D-like domain-containing protein n=1 Tax=Sphingomonas prati TaxID=1843237 RepID=A0A7W9BSF5_9SPHN|nr:hypothetical protein [Sphingomonas prati]MBB5729255.1 hypothetical protein [Sphingomonas prati]